MYEPTWSQPLTDWQQHGSFVQAATPPVDRPSGGTLVQLPCINEDWLPLLLGALDQLRNPSSWLPSLPDSGRAEVLARADELRSMIAMAVTNPCCAPAFRFTPDCHLQTSTDGGTTWTTVPGWDANLDACIKAHMPPQVPVPLQTVSTAQQACNIADFLSVNIIQQAVQKEVSAAQDNVQLLALIQPLMNALAPFFPITAAAESAFSELYQIYVQVQLAHWQAAQDDPALWDAVKCAIYNQIKTVGYVDATSYVAISTSIGSISYSPVDVLNGINAVWVGMGLSNVQSLQQMATAANGNCSECTSSATWCREWNFANNNGGWFDEGIGYGSTWVLGQGWRGGSGNVDGCSGLTIEVGFNATPTTLTEIEFDISCANVKCSAGTRGLTIAVGSTIEDFITLPSVAYPHGTTLIYPLSSVPAGSLNFEWPSVFLDSGVVLSRLRMKGTGTPPTLTGAVAC